MKNAVAFSRSDFADNFVYAWTEVRLIGNCDYPLFIFKRISRPSVGRRLSIYIVSSEAYMLLMIFVVLKQSLLIMYNVRYIVNRFI